MGIIRPATPGFLVTLLATILLVVVVFCVPYFKSVYFLKATITQNNVSGSITFGTLGYCIQIGASESCSKPSIGYQLDINGLVGNKLPVQIPQVVVKWITYLLFLHVIALVASAGSALFGLLAHVREMSMACCSTCFSGLAAVITLLAFIFDLVLFFVAKSRINAIGQASIGTAIWLTLAAWVLLFFSGCFYTIGRCCLGKRPKGGSGSGRGSKWDNWGFNKRSQGPDPDYSEQMRLDAVKAEADRKARAKQGEIGLPAFSETQPLNARVDGDQVYLDNAHGDSRTEVGSLQSKPSSGFRGGYVPGTPGTRTVDDYYGNQNAYPPHPAPRRQRSEASQYSRAPTVSPGPAHAYGAGYGQHNIPPTRSPSNNLLVPPGGYQDPYAREYGHAAGGSSYHTAASHGQDATSYTQYNGGYDAYNQPTPAPQTQYHDPYPQTSFNPDTFNQTAQIGGPSPGASNPYYNYPQTTSPPPSQQPERSYTLGGGYGDNSVPPLPEHQQYDAYNQTGYNQPQSIDTSMGGSSYGAPQATSPVGPRSQPGPDEAPPGYEPGPTGVTGNWGKR